MSNKKGFLIHFSHFFSGQAVILLIGFITFPILTRLLPVEEYGMLSLVTNTMLLTVAMAKAGLSDGIIRMHGDYTGSNEERTIFASTVCFGAATIALLVTLGYWSSLPLLSRFLNLNAKFQICFQVMTAYILVRPLNVACLNLLRSNGKTVFINLVNVANKMTAVTIGLVLLLFVIKDLYGFFTGIVISEYLAFLVLSHWFFRHYTVRPLSASARLARQLIIFGIPLLFTELSYLLLSYADRYIILFFHGESELGIYTAGQSLPMYIAGVITFSVSNAIVPLYVKVYNSEGAGATELFLRDSFHYLLMGLLPICFGYQAVVKDLYLLLATEKFADAALFSPLILVGSLLLGINSVLNAGLYLTKKTKVIFAIICMGVIINIPLNFLLIPKYPIFGAAWATLIACAFTSVFTVLFSFRYIRVRLKREALYHLLLSLIMYFSVNLISTNTPLLTLGLKVVTGGIIILSGILLIERELAAKLQELLWKKKWIGNPT